MSASGVEHGVVVPGQPSELGRALPLDGVVLSFTVVGKAEPAGSKRAFAHKSSGRVLVVDANRNAKPWQSAVAHAGAEAMRDRELLAGALRLVLVFFGPRPKGHYGSGRNVAVLKPSAPLFPTGRPDVLKLARSVEDALTGVVWRDDAQIVSEELTKVYGEPARVEVVVAPLGCV